MSDLTNNEINILDKYFRVSNYLAAGQLYLLDNPLLTEPLQRKDIKKKIVGHWGTVPGQNFVYTHLNRIIVKDDLNMIYVSGPGHGGNAMVAQDYIDGSYTEIYPNITKDLDGLKKLFKQFSFPGGISSHVAPETPGSINEGGELGYSLSHSFGAALDNPDLIVACVVGDGEAETGPLSASWHLNKILNPKKDGIVLPILHLNGYKISNPTIFSRISNKELISFFFGCGWQPIEVEIKSDENPTSYHTKMANAMDKCIDIIKKIKGTENISRPLYPMIILKTPKGWTGPKEVRGKIIEGTFRAHQVPVAIDIDEDISVLENWLKSYRPNELFNQDGSIIDEIVSFAPKGNRRMGMNPITNGGLLLKDLFVPDFKNYKLNFNYPGSIDAQDMTELGKFVRDIIKENKYNNNFRVFGPDEALSNRLNSIFEETNRQFNGIKHDFDEFLKDIDLIVIMVKHNHIKENWDKIKDKVILDCHNICPIEGAYKL